MKTKSNQEEIFDLKKIGNRIKKLRVDKQYTQAQLAKSIDVTTNYISLIENGKGKASLNVFYKLSIIFDITINELLYENKTTAEYHFKNFFDNASTYEISLVDDLIKSIEQNRKIRK